MAPKENKKAEEGEENFPGYEPYPVSEDMFVKGERADDVDPDDKSVKAPVPQEGQQSERNPEGEYGAGDLDIPGAELDDANEEIGNEDEENNYYSLGGDNHEDLEDDQATGLD